MSSSLCIVHHPPNRVELRECGLSQIGEKQYLVESHFTAVSPGTETRALQGKQAGVGSVQFVPGYQGVGTIIEAGPGCRLAPGTSVFFGGGGGFQDGVHAFWGSHAKRLVVDENKVFRLPAGISHCEASISKLGAIALHGIKAGRILEGDRVAVIGLGILGQLSGRLARLYGGEVTAFDINPERVGIANQAGVPAIVVTDSLKKTVASHFGPDQRFDAIIDVTGNARLLPDSMSLAHDLLPWDTPQIAPSRLVVQGSYPGEICLDYQQAFLKELHLIFPRDQVREDLEDILAMIADKRLAVGDLTGTPQSPLDAPSCYAEFRSADPHRLTSVFDWSLV